VQADQLMARMDTSDLMQQSVEVRAEIQRYRAEEDKARAANALADVQVSRYRREQAEAKLARVTYLLAQAEVRAPFDGVVVEGERRDLQGASLRRGEQMFRVAQVRDLYVVAQVSEKDVREVEPDAHAVAILLSQTSVEIPLKVVNFVPMAQVKGEQGNQFLLKAEIEGDVAAWWRPGMSGLVKVEAGSRNIGWILFHSVWDTLRLKFWW
jgi:multidrug resistance efflux pump